MLNEFKISTILGMVNNNKDINIHDVFEKFISLKIWKKILIKK